MLAARGLISGADADTIVAGLDRVCQEFVLGRPRAGSGTRRHPHEHRGPADRAHRCAGRRLHTARSRNDQVATDLRLYARRSALELVSAIDGSRRRSRRAREHATTLMPGYTHSNARRLCRWAPACSPTWRCWSAIRAAGRCERRDADPARSGALAGTGIRSTAQPSPPAGFRGGATHNSLDAVSDRDFAAESLRVRAGTRRTFRASANSSCGPRQSSVSSPRRRLQFGQLADAAETQSRHRGTDTRKTGARDRRPRRAADDQQGAGAGVQQGPSGIAGGRRCTTRSTPRSWRWACYPG